MTQEDRTRWFREARFGMFIHWGLYAIPARGEWVRSVERMPAEDYGKYFEAFNPSDYNPGEWARICKNAGMKYAVLTAKHHDGYCLFDSRLTDYTSARGACKRDLVREFLDAFRAEGLKVGLYYSLLDWHHPDFPHYGDDHHPMRFNEAYQNGGRSFDRYLDYMHGQIRELCTNYGLIDIFWFDFSYGRLSGEAWRGAEIVKMIRELQPRALLDNRLETAQSLLTDTPSVYSGDFTSPEQIIPPEGIVSASGKPVCWEACVTMNNNWGYTESDREYKSASVCIRKLAECVSKNGNLLLNVGPDARGKFPVQSEAVLEEVGGWMRRNGESIYGCAAAGLEDTHGIRYTARKNRLYVHVTEQTIGPVALKGVDPQNIRSCRLLSTGAELKVSNAWTTGGYPGYAFISLGPVDHHTYALPDERDTVIEIMLK